MTSTQGARQIPASVLSKLATVTGISSAEAWSNVLSLIGKAEQNDLRWWRASDGQSIYGYAERLSYDGSDRGVTIGLVGFTTHDGGKPQGDAQELFAAYKKLGGKDLAPMSKDCAKDKDAAKKLIREIAGLADDERWIRAQWDQLLGDGDSSYITMAMKICKDKGIAKPSALTIGALFDANLNHGYTGKNGGKDLASHTKTRGNEQQFLKEFLEIRQPIAGKNAFNDPPINGTNRVQQYIDLMKDGCWDLVGCDARIAKACDWKMK